MMRRSAARLDTNRTKPFLPLMAEEFGIELIRTLLGNPNSWGVLAGKTLGSIFLLSL